jgi:hypothetical protein
MKLDEVQRRMPGWYESGRSVYLKSSPGVGKTDVMKAAPAILSAHFKKNIGAVIINGPLLTPGDAVGYLMGNRAPDGRLESEYTEPFWFKTHEGKRLSEFDGGIVFVDEMDKADTDVKKVIGECALSGRLGPHKLAGGWVLWGAGNNAEDRSGSTKELDHLINRRMEVDVTPDLDAWTSWALSHGVSPLTVSFANSYPELVIGSKAPAKQGPWCTPRSLVGADDYIKILTRDNKGETPDDPSTVEEINGMIGSAAAQFFQHVKLEQEMPKYEKIVADPSGAKLPKKPDAQMMVCYHLAHKIKAPDAGAVIQYIERMSPEFAVTFAKAACKRDQSLVMAPAFNRWAQKNSSLMAAISEHQRAA